MRRYLLFESPCFGLLFLLGYSNWIYGQRQLQNELEALKKPGSEKSPPPLCRRPAKGVADGYKNSTVSLFSNRFEMIFDSFCDRRVENSVKSSRKATIPGTKSDFFYPSLWETDIPWRLR